MQLWHILFVRKIKLFQESHLRTSFAIWLFRLLFILKRVTWAYSMKTVSLLIEPKVLKASVKAVHHNMKCVFFFADT